MAPPESPPPLVAAAAAAVGVDVAVAVAVAVTVAREIEAVIVGRTTPTQRESALEL
jgi:hypothetical protein